LHQGGSVAAPVFNLIAEAALGDYAIPPDEKAFRESLVALSKKYESQLSEEAARQENQAAKAEIEIKRAPAPEAQAEPKGRADAKTISKSDQKSKVPKGGAGASLVSGNPSARVKPAVTPLPQPPPHPNDAIATYVMPDFRGRGVRAVTQACAQMNLVIRLHGSGVAIRQAPAAGAKVRAGDVCRVEFQ
jgi:hypothetical protein